MTDYRVFPATNGPPDSATDGQSLNLAMEFRTSGQTWCRALHFWRGTTAIAGTITGRLFTVDAVDSGTPVPGTDVTFVLSGTGWQTAVLGTPVELNPATRHKVAVRFEDQFPITAGFWSSGAGGSGIVNGPLTAYSNVDSVAGQGSFSTGALSNYPAASGNGANYWVDVTVTDQLDVRVVLDLAVDTSTAQPVTGVKRAALDLAVDTSTAHQLAVVHRCPLDLAAEADTAQPVGHCRAVSLHQAVEVDTALPVQVAGTLLVPGVHTTTSSVSGLSAGSSVSRLEVT